MKDRFRQTKELFYEGIPEIFKAFKSANQKELVFLICCIPAFVMVAVLVPIFNLLGFEIPEYR